MRFLKHYGTSISFVAFLSLFVKVKITGSWQQFLMFILIHRKLNKSFYVEAIPFSDSDLNTASKYELL